MISSTTCQKAQEYFIKEEYENALEYVERCITGTLRQNQKSIHSKSPQYYEAKFLEARIHTKLKNYEKASEIYSSLKSSLIGNDQETYLLKGKMFYFQSQLEYQMQNIDRCIELMIEAKNNFIKADEYKSALDLLFDIQEFTIIKNDVKQRLDILREIESLSKKLNNKDDRRLYEGKSKLLQGKITKYIDEKNAESLLGDAYKNFDKLDHSLLKAESLIEKSLIEERTNLSNAEKYLMIALEEINKSKGSQFKDLINVNLGKIKMYMGKDEEAGNYIQEAIEGIEETEFDQDLINSYLSLAKSSYVHSVSDDQLKLTSETINRSLSGCDQMDDRFGKSMCHILDGLTYIKMGDQEQGLSKLKLIKILIPKLYSDQAQNENAHWINEIINLIVKFNEPEFESIKPPKNPHPLFAEQTYIAGMYLLEGEQNEKGKILLQASRDAFDKLSSRKNSYKKIVEQLDQNYLN